MVKYGMAGSESIVPFTNCSSISVAGNFSGLKMAALSFATRLRMAGQFADCNAAILGNLLFSLIRTVSAIEISVALVMCAGEAYILVEVY